MGTLAVVGTVSPWLVLSLPILSGLLGSSPCRAGAVDHMQLGDVDVDVSAVSGVMLLVGLLPYGAQDDSFRREAVGRGTLEGGHEKTGLHHLHTSRRPVG